MLKSVRLISQLVSAEVDAGIPASRIVVGGFSQGELRERRWGKRELMRVQGLSSRCSRASRRRGSWRG